LLRDENFPIKQPSCLGSNYIATMLKCSFEEIPPICLVLGNTKGGHIIGDHYVSKFKAKYIILI